MLQGSIQFSGEPFTRNSSFIHYCSWLLSISAKILALVVFGRQVVRTLILVVIFFYFMFVWVSAINPTLRAISIFGMFVINLFMAYNLLLARLERPYRDALKPMTQEPDKHETHP